MQLLVDAGVGPIGREHAGFGRAYLRDAHCPLIGRVRRLNGQALNIEVQVLLALAHGHTSVLTATRVVLRRQLLIQILDLNRWDVL